MFICVYYCILINYCLSDKHLNHYVLLCFIVTDLMLVGKQSMLVYTVQFTVFTDTGMSDVSARIREVDH